MIKASAVISYLDMCEEEGVSLQRGMNFRLHGKFSIILMSLRRGAPYADKIEENGRVLIYEGHDSPRQKNSLDPKTVDQPITNPSGLPTQNGLFYREAIRYKNTKNRAELVKVYEKINPGIWVYNGLFRLVDAWQEMHNARKVFKFKLEIEDNTAIDDNVDGCEKLDHNRLIPAPVKLEVWNRDKGKCVICESKDNLHFDHIIPYSKGGSSLVAKNIQLLCARHNLAKRNKIE